MRRCYAHAPAAENPLRPEAPKSPWSRRIGFSAPSGHFRIVPFLIGCLVWSLGLLIDGRFFFVLYPASVSYGFVLWLLGGLFVSVFVFSARSFALRSPSFPMVPVSPRFSFPLRFVFHPLFFPSFFPMVSVFSLIPFKALLFLSSFPFFVFSLSAPPLSLFPFPAFPSSSFFLLPSFSLAWLACSFPFRGFRLRSGRFVFVLRFRLSASPRRNAPSGGGVGPIGQGCPQARGRPPRGWRGGAGPGSRTRAAMGGRGRRRRGGRRPMGSAGRRTRRSR